MWQLVFRVYISLFFTGHLYPQFVPRKLRPLLFLHNPSPSPSSSSSSELIPFNSNESDPEIIVRATKYQVFISFSGHDSRLTILSHLYRDLYEQKGISVYKDDVDLRKGVDISDALMEEIEASRVYELLLSPKYVESSWCLDELLKIFECVEKHKRMLIPVTYGMSFSEFEEKVPSYVAAGVPEKWTEQLLKVLKHSGLDYKVVVPETKLIDEVTKAIIEAIRGGSSSSKITVDLSSYSADKGLVGLKGKTKGLKALLRKWEKSNTTIGLWGMGGVGKTTLAWAFYDLYSPRSEVCHFINDFAALSPQHCSRSALFRTLLGDDGGVGAGTLPYDFMLERLAAKKVLLVIDDVGNDVGNIGPLMDLLNGPCSSSSSSDQLFGPGSVIIVTSRNQQLLKSVCHHVYEVKGLDEEEALQLFCSRAFPEESTVDPTDECLEMAKRAVDYADGNPLAITVLAAHLRDRKAAFWDAELRALKLNPNPMVESILRRSFEGLSRAERDVFLDIACFYDHVEIQRVEVMEAMAMSLEGGSVNLISNLVDMSLISINKERKTGCDHARILMNRLLQDLGRNIVDNEESEIEKRRRLWKPKDVHHLFERNKVTIKEKHFSKTPTRSCCFYKTYAWLDFALGDNNMGTRSIEGIFLQKRSDKFHSSIYIQTDAFVKMVNLRFLVIHGKTSKVILSENELKYLPNTLRILRWSYFASKYLPSEFSAENLITLELNNSEIEEFWKDDDELNMVRCKTHVQLGNLQSLNLSGSKKLRKLPDLSTAKRLEEIHLPNCDSLKELPKSILYLPKLNFLDVRGSRKLNWDNLEEYTANRTREHTSNILPNLRKLDLSRTRIQKVPSFITQLHIVELQCDECTELTESPVIPSLEVLTLTGSLIEKVVELEKYTELKHLKLSNNKQLVVLISGDYDVDCSKLKSMKQIKLDGCRKLARLPDSLGSLVHLEILDLSCTAVTELPSSTGDLVRLSRLILTCCKSLASLPDTMHKLRRLHCLFLDGCDRLRHLPELPSSLKCLTAHGCKSLRTVSVVEKLFSTYTNWRFTRCWKLDRVVCSKLVDKFGKDAVRISGDSSLLLPAKWDSEEGSTVGSNDNTIATAKFLGQPWKSKLTVFCALLNPVVVEGSKLGQTDQALLMNADSEFRIECVMLDNKDPAGAKVVSDCFWSPFRKYEDQQEVHLSKGHFVVWSTRKALVGETTADEEGSTLQFFFRGTYRANDQSKTVLNLIKNCRVIPVYHDPREVTYENEEKAVNDDQSPNVLQELYDQLCAHR